MKLIVLKKGIIIAAAVIVVLGVILGICCGVSATSVTAQTEKTIVIDAGHGGIDAGVYGVNTNVRESDINLAVSKYLRGYFVSAGFRVVMTRTSNGGLYGLPTKGFKMRDMKERKKIIEDNNADMVISVHQNKCPVPSKHGGTVFFDKSSDCGKALALAIQSELNGLNTSEKKNEALAGDYYMLKCTQNPSVIVECGFLSNPDDEKLLIDEEYQKKIAYAIFKGVIKYYT